MTRHWKPGDIFVWRGIYRNRIWHAVPTFLLQETPQEIVGGILPQAQCMVEQHYTPGVKAGKRRWDYVNEDWMLKEFPWHTNRVLTITEPEKYYSIMLFWNHASYEFLGYYVNFQLPFKKSHCGIDSLDLDLDIDIDPDLSFRWKDEDDYQMAIEQGAILPEWVQGIEMAKPEVLERLENATIHSTGPGWTRCQTTPGLHPHCPKIGIR